MTLSRHNISICHTIQQATARSVQHMMARICACMRLQCACHCLHMPHQCCHAYRHADRPANMPLADCNMAVSSQSTPTQPLLVCQGMFDDAHRCCACVCACAHSCAAHQLHTDVASIEASRRTIKVSIFTPCSHLDPVPTRVCLPALLHGVICDCHVFRYAATLLRPSPHAYLAAGCRL